MKTIKKILKWTGVSFGIIILILTIVVASRQDLKFEAPYPNVHATADSAMISRGKYLFFGPAHCMDCHTNKSDYPQIAELKDMPPTGGMEFILPIGKVYTPNITSHPVNGIGKITDEEVARTLRYGVSRDGRAIFDFMPFHNLSDSDLTAVISYLRTIPPVDKKVQNKDLNILGKVVNAFLLKPVGPSGDVKAVVTEDNTLAYGEYLAKSVANCYGCHTDRDLTTGAFIGPDFAGGLKIDAAGHPGKFYVTRNLTPDSKYGQIFQWDEEQFLNSFHSGKVYDDSPMPWESFKNISDKDLKAIYTYLKSLKPVAKDPGPVIVVEK